MRITLANILLLIWFLLGANFCLAQDASRGITSGDGIEAMMANGRKLLQQGELEKALQLFEAVLKKNPLDVEALFRAGTIYIRMNQMQKGIEYIERSSGAAPDNINLRIILAQTYERAQLWDKAIKAYQKVIDMAPNTPEAKEAEKHSRLLVGKQYGERGEYLQAMQAFSSVLKDYPNDVPALLDSGLTLLILGRLDQAQSVLEKALSIQPNDGLAHKYLGDVFDKKGDQLKSIEQYKQALKSLPKGSNIYSSVEIKLALNSGAQFLAKRQMADARREYEKVVALDPHNPTARFNLASIYHDLGMLSNSEQMLKSLSVDNPADLSVKVRLGTLYLEENKIQEAAETLGEVVAQGGNSLEAQQAQKLLDNIRSEAEKGQGSQMSNDEKIATLRSLLENNPNDGQAWFSLGMIFGQLRRHDEAIDAFKNVIRLNENNARALALLGSLYDDTGKEDEALDMLGRAMDLEKNDTQKQRLGRQIAMVLAKKTYSAGKLDEAAKEFKAIVDENNDDYLAHFFLGLIYSRKQLTEQAEKEYEQVLRIVPGHVLAKLNLAAIHEQNGHEEEAINEYRAVVISGAPGLSDTAKQRLALLMKKVGGFTFGAGYSINFDSNSNLSPNNPSQELRSDATGSMSYQRKMKGKRLFWGVRVNPAYSIYHKQQFDFLTIQASPFLNGVWRDLNWSANYSYSQTDGVLVQQNYNRSSTLYADAFMRFKMRALLGFLAADDQRDSTPSVWRINGSYRSFTSTTSPIFNADGFSFGALLNQGSTSGWSWTGSYNYSNNKNLLPIGNDFAYSSHGINLQLSKNISPKLSANGGYGFIYSRYTHPDSVTRFTKFRINKFHSLSLGLNYVMTDDMRLYCNVIYQRNDSNLPTGFILSTENVSTAVGIQSPSLGDYHKYGITAGISLNF